MTTHAFLVFGLMVGFAIAVPIGPMGLLCIQRTLATGMTAGVSTGLGAVTVNVGYGVVVLWGLDTLTPWIAGSQRLLSALGGMFLLGSAVQTLSRGTMREPPEPAALSLRAAYGTAVVFNATNPMALILILALLSPVAGASAPSVAEAALLLLGMLIAATTWWVCLSGLDARTPEPGGAGICEPWRRTVAERLRRHRPGALRSNVEADSSLGPRMQHQAMIAMPVRACGHRR